MTVYTGTSTTGLPQNIFQEGGSLELLSMSTGSTAAGLVPQIIGYWSLKVQSLFAGASVIWLELASGKVYGDGFSWQPSSADTAPYSNYRLDITWDQPGLNWSCTTTFLNAIAIAAGPPGPAGAPGAAGPPGTSAPAFSFSQSPLASASTWSFNHGLARIPYMTVLRLQNLTAEDNWTPGDTIECSSASTYYWYGSSYVYSMNFATILTASQIIVKSGNTLSGLDKNGYGACSLTWGNWKLLGYAW